MSDNAPTITVKLPPRHRRTPALNAVVNAAPTAASTPRMRSKPRPTEPEDPRLAEISPAARALAIAFFVHDAIESGRCKSYKSAARQLGISEARVNQLSQLMSLSPRVVEAVVIGEIDVSVRDLQWAVRSRSWRNQSICSAGRVGFPSVVPSAEPHPSTVAAAVARAGNSGYASLLSFGSSGSSGGKS